MNPFSTLTKRQKVTLSVGGVAFLSLVGFSFFAYRQQNQKSVSDTTPLSTLSPTVTNPVPSLPPAITKVGNRVNGALVDPIQEAERPLAVMIENHPDARPQSGLGQADLVYEAIAEGGITRFMAVFAHAQTAVRVGPIRSARTYFVDFATELSAFYAHVGGSQPALAQISRTNVLDLNQFSVGSPVYQRDFSRKVALEHTMYSSTEKLWNYAIQTKKWSGTTNLASWNYTDESALRVQAVNQKVVVDVSDPLYTVVWDYNKDSNSYARTMAGTPHTDANTSQQITAKTIILQEVARKPIIEAGNKQIFEYSLTGSGNVTVILNGTVIKGTWKKKGTDRTRFYDTANKEIALNRGSIWVHIVHPDSSISITP